MASKEIYWLLHNKCCLELGVSSCVPLTICKWLLTKGVNIQKSYLYCLKNGRYESLMPKTIEWMARVLEVGQEEIPLRLAPNRHKKPVAVKRVTVNFLSLKLK